MVPIARVIVLILLGFAAGAHAAGGAGDLRLVPAATNRLDVPSLQRGARNFVNWCLNCHSAKYMRYNRLTDLGIDVSMIQDNLMFATDKIGSTMTVAMSPADGKAWFGASPPDLTVEARVRGRDWLYNYLLGFYRDPQSTTGWNNLVFPNVAMPHVAWHLSGSSKLVEAQFDDHEMATAAPIAVKGLSLVAARPGNKWAVLTLAQDTPGELDRVQYEAWAADLVNFLDYMAEPTKNTRINVGIAALLFLGVLFVFAYWTKREYWKDVH
jgi:ubiquinol-cytochrome c reductase cytochrome c1 subunit